jgi:hypothetical protein
VIAHAQAKGCNWINFDQDADAEDGLVLHEW